MQEQLNQLTAALAANTELTEQMANHVSGLGSDLKAFKIEDAKWKTDDFKWKGSVNVFMEEMSPVKDGLHTFQSINKFIKWLGFPAIGAFIAWLFMK